ncbi:MAG: PAS domain-containing protein [Deltaproteobacteria bacterium]|nr:PAS domain-containing protein [Deltaproteobacteria bacterium]
MARELQHLVDPAFLGEIIDHIAHPIFIKDRQFRWVLLNQAFAEMVGYPREEMLGKSDFDFFPEAEARFFRAKDVEMFSSSKPVFIEEEPITDGRGNRHILATTKVPLSGPDGRVMYLVGIIHDITQLKTAQDALREANAALDQRVAERTAELHAARDELVRKERLAVLGRLAGGVAHQIRNPLGAITNALAILRRELGPDAGPTVAGALQVIHDEAWAANRIITDLLDYARVRRPSRTQIDLRHVVERVLALEELPRGVTCTVELDELPPIEADFEQLTGALGNLVRNAIEALPHGGTITITGKREGEQLLLTVRDSGAGVPASIRERLFQPLVTTKPLGIGLGLTTARSLVENHGGTLRECGGAEGACFELRLPIEPAPEVTPVAPAG